MAFRESCALEITSPFRGRWRRRSKNVLKQLSSVLPQWRARPRGEPEGKTDARPTSPEERRRDSRSWWRRRRVQPLDAESERSEMSERGCAAQPY